MLLLGPPLRALAQMDDPVFLGVVWRSVAWTLLAFAALAAGLVWGGHAALAAHGWLGWVAGALGGVGAALLALYLFLPLASVIASLFADRVAAAVERRFYPGLPPARPAPLAQQAWDGIALGLRVLGWQVVTLLLLLIPPLAPIAVPAGWLISAWSVGRGLFVAVAMRRMDRFHAAAAYRGLRPAVLAQGALMAVASLVPVFNLFVPVLGTAAMVHLLHAARAASGRPHGVATRGRV
jgi:CysZ protein